MEVLSSRIILRPVDLERSLRFYGQTLGLKIYREYGSGADRGVVFFIGGGYLEITGRASAVDVDKVSLWLQVPNLVEAHQQLSGAGVEIVDPPERKPWGLDEMWILDPDGLTIVIVQVPEDHPLRHRP